MDCHQPVNSSSYSYTPEDTNENRRRSTYQDSSASIPVFLLLLSDREPAVSYVRVLRDGRLGPDSDFEAQRSIKKPSGSLRRSGTY